MARSRLVAVKGLTRTLTFVSAIFGDVPVGRTCRFAEWPMVVG